MRLGVLEGDLSAANVGQALHPLPPPSIIISTIPASVPGANNAPDGIGGGGGANGTYAGVGIIPDVGLRRDVLDLSPGGGVAVELAYQPRKTPLLALVEQVNSNPAPRAAVLSGETTPTGRSPPPQPVLPATKYGHSNLGGSTSVAVVPSNAPIPQMPNFPLNLNPNANNTDPNQNSEYSSLQLTNGPWVAVEGAEILLEQGYEQVRLWTSRRAPRAQIRNVVMREFERHVREGLA